MIFIRSVLREAEFIVLVIDEYFGMPMEKVSSQDFIYFKDQDDAVEIGGDSEKHRRDGVFIKSFLAKN